MRHRRQLFISRLILLGFTLGLVGGAVNPVQAAVDLTIATLEITQAVQTPTSSVALVSQRGTAVRATLAVTGATSPISGVTGRLHVFVNGTAITPAAGLAPINAPFDVPTLPSRANQNDTLNFELPAPSGITASTDVDFQVVIDPVAGEADTANNTAQASNLAFVNRNTPSLFYTRVDYTPAGLGSPSDADVAAGVGDAFVRGIYPVNDSDPNLYRPGLFPTLAFGDDTDGDGQLDRTPDGSKMNSFLASCRQLIVDRGLGANDSTFLYGWVAGNPMVNDSGGTYNGLAPIGGRVGFGNTEQQRFQRTFAHELGHQFGLDHPKDASGTEIDLLTDQVGWDVGARLSGNPSGNNVPAAASGGRVKDTTLRDIMVGGQLTDGAWVDTITYTFFFNSSPLSSSPDVAEGADAPSERVVVIQGIFDPSGRELISLEPVFRFPWLSQRTAALPGGEYLAEVIDEAGNVTVATFDPREGDDAGQPDGDPYGFFEVMVPAAPALEIVSVRITNLDGSIEYGALGRSEPPTIAITAPATGAALGDTTEVAWDVTDPDTPIDDFMYQVAYSPDGGKTWVPISVDVPGNQTSIVFDSTQIQESGGQGVIRVFASDGLNTAFADVDLLETTAAAYPPPGD